MPRRLSKGLSEAVAAPDRVLAYLAFGASLILLSIGITRASPVALALAVLFGIPGVLWILTKGKAPFGAGISLSDDAFLSVSGLFFLLLACAIGSFVLRELPYTRPIIIFVLIPVMVGLTAVAALGASRPLHEHIGLVQVVIIGLFLSWSQILMIPDVIGLDPWFHQALTANLIQTQALPVDSLYSDYIYFPIFHLTVAAMSLMTGLPYYLSSMLSVSLLIVLVDSIFAYLLANELVPRCRALRVLAPLLVVTAPLHIYMTYWLIPNGFATIFILPVLFILYRSKGRLSRTAVILLALLLGALLLTHTISALFMAIVLFGSWAAFRLHARFVARAESFPLLLPVIFTIALLVWWGIDGNSLQTVLDLISNRFSMDYFSPEFSDLIPRFRPAPLWERQLLAISQYIVLFLPFLGMLWMLSRRGTRLTYNLALLGVVPLMMLSLTYLFRITVIEDRWTYFAALLNGIAVAITLLILLGRLSGKTGRFKHISLAVVLLLLCSLTFLAMVSPNASTDYRPLAPNAPGGRLVGSELVAVSTADAVWNETIWTDHYYARSQRWSFPAISDFTLQLSDRNFSVMSQDTVLIRDQTIRAPLYLYSWDFIPYYDVDDALLADGYSRVYDIGTVRGYRVSRA